MNKYKVEFIQKETFIVDVLAENEEKAREIAKKCWQDINDKGVGHFHQVGDMETEDGTIYNVTVTDDPFDPVN
jgi:hypothetical protein